MVIVSHCPSPVDTSDKSLKKEVTNIRSVNTV